ncbi:cytochrome P450 [Imleria badia]|nr:cytochrome P450 [Imleria badia]
MQSLSPAQLSVIIPVLIVAIDVIRRFIQGKLERKGLPLPPGPTAVPILGNILSVDRESPWKTYTEWHSVYGEIFYHRLLDQDVVVLGSQSVAVQLLEKRSRLYSDRPFVATLEPYGMDCIFAFTPYGEHWRSCRRILHQTFRADTVPNLHPMQLRKARQLVINLIDTPDRYEHHYSTFGIAVPLSASYDYETKAQDDPLVCAFEHFAAAAVPAATPERAVLHKLFPFLLHIPDWFPGSSLKREAKRARGLSAQLTEVPYHHIAGRLETSTERPMTSMVSDHLTCMPEFPDQLQRAKHVFNLKKAAVSSILASSLMVFTLAMVLNPRVWKRAHVEIDAVVGTGRLPDFGDRPALPYVNAIVRETLRWRPVVPLGVWHATSNSDVYNGQYIPKGATVVANAWAMSRDEARFPNAEDFVPERFLDDEGMLNMNDPMDFVFGFGRRICPGRDVADATLFAAIVAILATFEFSPLKDAQGNDLAVQVTWISGVTHRPKAFPCRIAPRAHVNRSYLERIDAELNL